MQLFHHYADLPNDFHAHTLPEKSSNPTLIRLNTSLCKELSFEKNYFTTKDGLGILAGNVIPGKAKPVAMNYAGHQFGHWNPQMGDGRAILLGEVKDRTGILRDIHLKGSGRTPFSRGGDGKATLGAVLREYILSEAMFSLGIPTTRALSVVTTGETVRRQTLEPGAILARVAQSHVRIGTFEYFSKHRNPTTLKILADYIIDRHYPNARETLNCYEGLLELVIERQAKLVARWMQVGFIHGVMNTDNMQIVGETIDYGPCAFMDDFRHDTVFSSIDHHGRYAWEQQPRIAKWNLTQFAKSLETLCPTGQNRVADFDIIFQAEFLDGFLRKLGLPNIIQPNEIIKKTLMLLENNQVDFTQFFRELTKTAMGKSSESLLALFANPKPGQEWLENWSTLFNAPSSHSKESRAALMRGVNPIRIPRNHRVEEAIEAARNKDYLPFENLVQALSTPYEENTGFTAYELAPTQEEKVLQTFCGT